jgi:hypothetical protein
MRRFVLLLSALLPLQQHQFNITNVCAVCISSVYVLSEVRMCAGYSIFLSKVVKSTNWLCKQSEGEDSLEVGLVFDYPFG